MASKGSRFSVARVVAFAMTLAVGATSLPSAYADTRSADFGMSRVESAAADAKYVPMFDPAARWPATFQWKYNHAMAPAALDKASVIATLRSSFDKWSSQCNVQHVYAGETTVPQHATDGVK